MSKYQTAASILSFRTVILTFYLRSFLLAQLYLNSLAGKRSPKAIRSALNALSSGFEKYESAYDDAMKRIHGQLPDQIEMAIQVLSWITCAKRPLTTTELRTALAVEVGEPEFDPDNLPDLTDMISVCTGLVTVDEQSDIIRLAHYTTQEYFERTQATWFPRAHHDIGRICVAYLSLVIFNAEPRLIKSALEIYREFARDPRSQIHISRLLPEYPLFLYAGDFWCHHVNARLHDDDLEAGHNHTIEFLSDISQIYCRTRVLLWLDSPSFARDSHNPENYYFFGNDRYPISSSRLATGLHLAFWFVMPHIVQKMISLGWPVDAKDVWGRTPLFWAVYFDLADIVSLLLEHGADPCMRDQDGNTPLLQSASTVSVNSITIARLLLEKVTKRQLKGTREYENTRPCAVQLTTIRQHWSSRFLLMSRARATSSKS